MKRKKSLLVLLISLIALQSSLYSPKTRAFTGARLYADPAVKLVGDNETYTFDVRLENASRVTVIALCLSFDPTKLNITEIQIGDALPGGSLHIGEWNPSTGTIIDITTVVMGAWYDVDNKTAVTITVETHDLGPGTIIDLWGMSCWDVDMNQFLSGDTPYDHEVVNVAAPIKVGVLGPMTWNQGQGMREGAEIARDEINAGTGIYGFRVELVYADTLRGQPYPTSSTGTAAATELVNAGCSFVIGGYWNESVCGAREVLMSNRTIFAVTSTSDDRLTDAVRTDYARYKYFFRVAPTNLTTQAQTLMNFSRSTFASGPVKIAVVSENIAMWDELHTKLTNPSIYTRPDMLGPDANVTYSTRVNISQTDFTSIWQGINASGAQYVIHLFATRAGVNFIKQWRELAIKVKPVGINLESENPEFWQDTEGKCDGETIVAISGTNTPLSNISLQLHDKTTLRYGHAPISTAFGVYDAIFTVKEAIERAGTTDSDAVVPELEKTDRISARGRLRFTSDHDVFCNEIGANWASGFVRPLVTQWRPDPLFGGRREVVFPKYDKAQSFTRKWSTPIWINPIADDDLSPNGEIDVLDAIILAGNFHKKAGDPGWNGECDFDGNGIVDIADASRLQRDFGKNSSSKMSETMSATSQNVGIAGAGLDTIVYLSPATINCTKVGIGNSVTVSVNISNAVDIYSWQAGITFNATLLECTNVYQGEFLQDVGGIFVGYTGQKNSTSGEIKSYAGTLQGDYKASGNGRLMYAVFMVKANGISDIHLSDVMVMDYWGVQAYQMIQFQIVDVYTTIHYTPWTVTILSNSTGTTTSYECIDDASVVVRVGSGLYDHAFNRPVEMLHFNVTGPFPGHSNVTIPKTLIPVNYSDQLLVVIDSIPLRTNERTVTENSTHYFAYFNYSQHPHDVEIQRRPPVHNLDANKYYSTINSAINSNATLEGHTILAFAGTCNESVLINKTISLVGEHKTNTTIDGRGTGTVIKITTNNVNVSGFTIRNSGSLQNGILIQGSSGNTISDNVLTNNYYGILVNCSSNNVLANNTMSDNKYNFGLYGETDADFDNAIDASNKADGKSVLYVSDVSDAIYDLSANIGTLYLVNCNNITVKDVTPSKNVHGILLRKTTGTNIQNITSSNNTIGICLDNSNNNIIFHNRFIWNNVHGTAEESYDNVWDDDYPSGGNYWSGYDETDYYRGPNQDLINNDGILDQAYAIDADNHDRYPLISPLEPPVYNTGSNLGYTKIQDAINAAQTSNGHTIIVRSGTYDERLMVNKSVTLVGIDGSTIINAGGATAAVTITASNAVFRDFTLQGNASTVKAILVSFANTTAIRENVINGSNWGIDLDRSYGCYIGGNIITSQSADGIILEYSNNNSISRNDLASGVNGIHLIYSSGNAIRRNNFINNTQRGVFLYTSSDNKIYHNNFINNSDQCDVYLSSNIWDDGATSGGNYWSDYLTTYPVAKEIDDTGIGNTAYVIDPPTNDNVDRYPLWSERIPEHDIALVSVTPSKTAVGQNFTVSIYVTLENQGEYTEMFDLTLSNPLTRKTTALLPETLVLYTFVWNTSGPPMVPMGNYTISANVTCLLGETDTLDNNLTYGLVTITYPGDFCLPGKLPDLKVGPADFALLSTSYGSKLGDPKWNPNCDVNNDNKVGPADFAWLSKDYGQPRP